MKQYTFTEEELYVLRDALTEYWHFIKPTATDPEPSGNRVATFKIAGALKEQFRDDVRLFRG